MIVVSDASPITTLLKADQATLLKRLFDFVVIPEAVSEELLAFHAQPPASFASSRSPLGITGCRVRKTWAKARLKRFNWQKKLVQTFC
jgi:hypothetical protein